MDVDRDAVDKALEWEPLVGRVISGNRDFQATGFLLTPNRLLTCAHVLVDDQKVEEVVTLAQERLSQSCSDLDTEINNIIRANKEIIDRIKD